MARTKNTIRKKPESRPPEMTDAVFSMEQRAPRSCGECDRQFKSVSSLRRHSIIKHRKTVGVAVGHNQIEQTWQGQRHRVSDGRRRKDCDRPADYASEDVADTSPAPVSSNGKRRSSAASVASDGQHRSSATPATVAARRSSLASVISGVSRRSSTAAVIAEIPAAVAFTADRPQTSPLSAIVRRRPPASRTVVTTSDHWYEPMSVSFGTIHGCKSDSINWRNRQRACDDTKWVLIIGGSMFSYKLRYKSSSWSSSGIAHWSKFEVCACVVCKLVAV